MRTVVKMVKFWFFVIFVVLGIFIGINNRDLVALNFPPFFPSMTMPVFILVLGAFIVGAVMASVWFLVDSIPKNLEVRKLRRQLKNLSPESDDDIKNDAKNFFR